MAKDGTMRGGARVGSGRKSKALTEKIDSGLAATVIDLPEPEEINGEDVPPVGSVFVLLPQPQSINTSSRQAVIFLIFSPYFLYNYCGSAG